MSIKVLEKRAQELRELAEGLLHIHCDDVSCGNCPFNNNKDKVLKSKLTKLTQANCGLCVIRGSIIVVLDNRLEGEEHEQ
jgi:hypothetical protein